MSNRIKVSKGFYGNEATNIVKGNDEKTYEVLTMERWDKLIHCTASIVIIQENDKSVCHLGKSFLLCKEERLATSKAITDIHRTALGRLDKMIEANEVCNYYEFEERAFRA